MTIYQCDKCGKQSTEPTIHKPAVIPFYMCKKCHQADREYWQREEARLMDRLYTRNGQ